MGSVESSSLGVEKSGSLFGKLLFLLVFTLLLVDLFNQDTLGLVTVTLGESVEVSIHVLVDLASLTVLSEESTKDTNTTHPQDLFGNTSVHGTVSLTVTSVITTGLGVVTNVDTRARVHHLMLLDNKTALDELADVLTRVSEGNVVNFAGVHPNLAHTALKDGGSKSLLKLEANHDDNKFCKNDHNLKIQSRLLFEMIDFPRK